MTEEIKTCNNNQKMSVYCKTCVCKSCEQIKRLEQENKELKKENETLSYQWCKQSEIGDEWYKLAEKYKTALEEIREMILYCEDEYNCDRCKYHDNCSVDDDKFPDFSRALINRINEVLCNENRE